MFMNIKTEEDFINLCQKLGGVVKITKLEDDVFEEVLSCEILDVNPLKTARASGILWETRVTFPVDYDDELGIYTVKEVVLSCSGVPADVEGGDMGFIEKIEAKKILGDLRCKIIVR